MNDEPRRAVVRRYDSSVTLWLFLAWTAATLWTKNTETIVTSLTLDTVISPLRFITLKTILPLKSMRCTPLTDMTFSTRCCSSSSVAMLGCPFLALHVPICEVFKWMRIVLFLARNTLFSLLRTHIQSKLLPCGHCSCIRLSSLSSGLETGLADIDATSIPREKSFKVELTISKKNPHILANPFTLVANTDGPWWPSYSTTMPVLFFPFTINPSIRYLDLSMSSAEPTIRP